jgi:hypothetical protein
MRKTIGLISVVLAMVLFVMSCSKITEDYVKGYDTDPLLPLTAPETKLFVGAQSAFIEFYEGFPSKLAAVWTQQATGTDRQFASFDNYNVTANDFSNDWFLAYTRVLTNLRLVQEKAKALGKNNLYGAAKVLEGLLMGTVAALWGDVPYSEAVKWEEGILTPKYDNQIDVYNAAIAALDTGIKYLTLDATNLPEDIYSTGRLASKWKKVAYSAKARYLMHLARKDNYPTTILDQVIQAGINGITSTTRTGTAPTAGYGADDLVFTHGTVRQGNRNLWYEFIVIDRRGYLAAQKCFATKMFGERGTAESARFRYYFTADSVSLNTSSTGAYAQNAYYPVIRASETLLLIAEAYARKGDLANAVSYLNQARSYVNNIFGTTLRTDLKLADDFGSDQARVLQAIFNEMYLALMHQVEVFNFLRRIDYKVNYVDRNGNTVWLKPKYGEKFPERFFYPQSEVSTNPNTPKQTYDDLFEKTRVNGGTK